MLVFEDGNDNTGVTYVNFLIKTIQSISAKIHYVFFTKILQGGDTASGIVFHNRCSRICG